MEAADAKRAQAEAARSARGREKVLQLPGNEAVDITVPADSVSVVGPLTAIVADAAAFMAVSMARAETRCAS